MNESGITLRQKKNGNKQINNSKVDLRCTIMTSLLINALTY